MASADPYKIFDDWWKEAVGAIKHPDVMILATANKRGKPSARVVLYKGLYDGKILFVTNFESRKGSELIENPLASLVFYWEPLDRQVRVEGTVEKASAAESDRYWATRPRDSQLSAWASQQSRAIKDRRELEERVQKLQTQYEGKDIPRPPFWGGFFITPEVFEFWTNKANRLHERHAFTKKGKAWDFETLSP